MELELEKLRIEQLGKAYLDSSVSKDPEKRGISCHKLATTNVVELLSTWMRISHQKIRGFIDYVAQMSVIHEEISCLVEYEGDGHIEIVSAFREKEMAPLRIFEMSTGSGAHWCVTVSFAVSKKLANDLHLSTTAFES
ncbi:retrovirus-related Pol polyprotein from transposon 297 [Nephila pilipes]|uniref:Retrovirus-related Pol polyprotein from transposon 297 n=1 Tax=Nephila pilipes TaxID=299642 RepID=A0A8X6TCE7_NEPPI|nr:retrovirus-related Pol polyprotein from transposon 297 [Nephila pilipes]